MTPEDSILDSDARFNIWGGPVRSGKTVHSMMLRWMIGKTLGSLERNILAPLRGLTSAAFGYSFSQGKT
ncbi:hypothetical protein [Deinococcus hopiensis]|uniref:hypothetical protein n=1 Tax=Deinococcus hopiensis TaxID=309885 RepID=UPI000A038DB2|nr:hypothetical protein [Deinococcus hopiensis]